jgi:hypothetical protein
MFWLLREKNSWAAGGLPDCGLPTDPQPKDLTKVFLLLCRQFMEPNATLPDKI